VRKATPVAAIRFDLVSLIIISFLAVTFCCSNRSIRYWGVGQLDSAIRILVNVVKRSPLPPFHSATIMPTLRFAYDAQWISSERH